MRKQTENPIVGSMAACSVALLWSVMGLFIKSLSWAAMSINAARCFVALCLKVVFRKGKRLKITPNTVLAALCFVGETVLFVCANKFTTAGNATVLQYSSTFFIILLERLFNKKKPHKTQLLCAVGTVVGVVLCCLSNVTLKSSVGNIFAVCGGLCYGGMLFFNAKQPQYADDANLLGFLLGALIGLPFLLCEHSIDLHSIILVVVLGAVLMWLPYLLLEFALKRIDALHVNLICALETIFSPLWASLFFQERITIPTVVGGILILFSSLSYTRVEKN